MTRASGEREDLLKKLQESTDTEEQLLLRVILMDKAQQERLVSMVNNAFPMRTAA